jgi:hypothetical protein
MVQEKKTNGWGGERNENDTEHQICALVSEQFVLVHGCLF